MKFRYLGDKKDMQAFGYDFSNGATPDVTDEFAIMKLSGNNHFEVAESFEEVKEPARRGRKAQPLAFGPVEAPEAVTEEV